VKKIQMASFNFPGGWFFRIKKLLNPKGPLEAKLFDPASAQVLARFQGLIDAQGEGDLGPPSGLGGRGLGLAQGAVLGGPV
jgi:hypothetical protein